MTGNQVLIISFWNPTAKYPQQGIFIQEQAAAICSLRDNVVFFQVNVLPSNKLCITRTIEESTFYDNRQIIVNIYSRLWKLLYVNPWWLEWTIYRIIKNRSYIKDTAIIHSNVIFPCGIVGYFLSKRIGARLVISEHWSKAVKLLHHPLYRRIALKAYRISSAVICVSEFLASQIRKETGHANVIVIPNIIKSDIFNYIPKPSPSDGKLSFTCIGSWRLPKRLDLIVEALCFFSLETSLEIDLVVVGEGKQTDILKTRVTPGNLHIKWLGYLEKKVLATLLQSTRIFLHASEIETFSIVTAEALSTGTPVLASNVGALPELINENNGILVNNTPDAWLNGLRKIVSNKFDNETIAINCQNKYSGAAVGNNIILVYNKISDGTL